MQVTYQGLQTAYIFDLCIQTQGCRNTPDLRLSLPPTQFPFEIYHCKYFKKHSSRFPRPCPWVCADLMALQGKILIQNICQCFSYQYPHHG